MGGQGSPRHAAAAGSPALAGIRVVDSPVLLLVCFHKALREDLSNLHLLAASSVTGPLERETILELRRRYQFLQMVYKYHSAAEDEVIFRALDLRVRNVACTYSLEHGAINNLFDNVFYLLDALLEDDETSLKTCQELSLCTSTIQASICQHMLKEEEQVFPLMMQRFSFKEQALLVWQFMCSVPIILLEDFLPWMISYLSVDEQADILHCIKEIVPKEKLLQEVVISWLGKKSRTSYGTYNAGQKENEASPSNEELSLKEFPKIYSHRKSLTGEKCHHRESIVNPIDGVRLWYSVIRKELKEILDELHEIKRLKIFSSLSLVSSRIMFVADVLIFYSEALEKVIFPVLNGHGDGRVSLSHQRFPEESQIEGLLHVLRDFNAQNGRSLHELVEKLCWQLESFMIGTTQHFEFQESEVFPPIRKNCDHEMQRSLLYSSFLVMPLGLLKCAITWLSAHITEEESKTICFSIRLAGPTYDVAFTSLLIEWFCIGYSGKTSRENFRKDLQEMFKTRSSFIVKQIEEGSGFFPVDLDARPCKRPHPGRVNENITEKANHIEIPTHASCDLWSLASNSSSSKPQNYEKCSTSYSRGINMQIFFSESLKKVSPIPKLHSQEADAGSSTFQESKPIDPIFHFHKALEKDLEYFVLESARMVEKVEVLLEFRPRFHLVQVLYQAHSNAEDEIAFPALEAIGTLQNISGSYSLDHKLEEEHFRSISRVLDEISELNAHLCSGVSSIVGMATLDWRMVRHRELCVKLHSMCKSMQITLGQHIHREEIELWPLFLKHFSEEEQERIVGSIIGRTRAEILQRMIPWLLASLTPSEQHTMMTSWRKVTKNTMFDEWLAEWWEGMKRNDFTAVGEEQNILPSGTEDSLEIVAAYLSKEGFSAQPRENLHDKGLKFLEGNSDGVKTKDSGNVNGVNQVKVLSGNRDSNQFSECTKVKTESNKKKYERTLDVIDRIEKPGQLSLMTKKFKHHEEHLLTMSQEDLEAAVRKVSNDAALDPHKKSYIIQNLLMSRWIITQQKLSHSEEITSTNGGEIPGHTASYQDPLKLTFGCKHYKRNCKLLAACCNRLFTCRYCHDNASDHEMDRKLTTKMMCMKCLHIQPIGPRCAKHSCNSFSMARYFCSICKLFDDEREIYHCPFCNLCRIGKGLGIDYFHCMNCNACMSKSLTVHTCREKCFESNCPICHDDIFTSSIPVKALSCGHLMHSTCFQDYTCTHYTCPICSKSLGDMQVYFGMLDALLAEEKIPQEYCGQTQDILCNDCEKRGVAPFHWLYHKCPHCSSYNTRLL